MEFFANPQEEFLQQEKRKVWINNRVKHETWILQRRAWIMTKADLVETIYEKVGFSRKESAEIVDLVFDLMKETLEGGEKIKISGFGNFIIREKRSRKGRNPQTGEEIQISARRVLTFKPSQVLRKALNTNWISSHRGSLGSAASQGDRRPWKEK